MDEVCDDSSTVLPNVDDQEQQHDQQQQQPGPPVYCQASGQGVGQPDRHIESSALLFRQ
jgi:hypothetical protein